MFCSTSQVAKSANKVAAADRVVDIAGMLRVWWTPQIPGPAFIRTVRSVHEAYRLLDTLARYDRFQFVHNIKPDYSNAGGLEVWEDGEWVEWMGDAGETINEVDDSWFDKNPGI